MDIFHYDRDTGEFLGMGVADPDPMDEDNWLIPANATLLEPPVAMKGNARVFRNGAWGYVHVDAPDGPSSNEPAPPTANDIAVERNKRLAGGFLYDFGDARGSHHIATSKEDLENWNEVTQIANALIMSGHPDTPIGIMTDTGATEVTAMEWQSILIKAGQVRQPVFAASFALQAMSPIPFDYTDEKYWPRNDTEVFEELAPVDESQNAPWTPPSELEPPSEEPPVEEPPVEEPQP